MIIAAIIFFCLAVKVSSKGENTLALLLIALMFICFWLGEKR